MNICICITDHVAVHLKLTRHCKSTTMLCLVAQSRPTLCNSMDCSPAGSSVHVNSPGKKSGMGCHVLLQGLFPTQGSNPGLPHCRRILYHLSHQESLPIIFFKACYYASLNNSLCLIKITYIILFIYNI